MILPQWFSPNNRAPVVLMENLVELMWPPLCRLILTLDSILTQVRLVPSMPVWLSRLEVVKAKKNRACSGMPGIAQPRVLQRVLQRVLDHSEDLMPAALMTLPRRWVSSCRNFAKPCGVLAMTAVSVSAIFLVTIGSLLEIWK